jgi:hypothetical protein
MTGGILGAAAKSARNYLESIKPRRNRLLFQVLARSAALKALVRPFTGKRMRVVAFQTIQDRSASTSELEILFTESRTLSCSRPVFFRQPFQFTPSAMIEVGPRLEYAVVLRDAAVVGGSSLVLLDAAHALYDLKFNDPRQNYRYSDVAIREWDGAHCLVSMRPSGVSIDKGIFMLGNYSWNYYHLLFEILVRFERIDSLGLPAEIPLLVDRACLERPQYVQLLTMLNVPARPIIALDPGQSYDVRSLYYLSCPNQIPPNFVDEASIRPEDILFDLTSLTALKTRLMAHASKGSAFPKRLFLTRANASGRRRFNEEQVLAVLAQYGFSSVAPEKLTVAEQIELFSGAELIAGGSGAAFSNLLFCSAGCKAIVFSKREQPLSAFSTIAAHSGVELVYLSEQQGPAASSGVHDDFEIDCGKLKALMDSWSD